MLYNLLLLYQEIISKMLCINGNKGTTETTQKISN